MTITLIENNKETKVVSDKRKRMPEQVIRRQGKLYVYIGSYE